MHAKDREFATALHALFGLPKPRYWQANISFAGKQILASRFSGVALD
jgi:hypothetical protein